MSEASKIQSAYGAEQIQVLEGLEPVSYTHLTLPTKA